MEITLYKTVADVPKRYTKYLRTMGMDTGLLLPIYFGRPQCIVDIVLVTNEKDIPMSWAMMTHKSTILHGHKSIMLFTRPSHRRKGYGTLCYKMLAERHPDFWAHKATRNEEFFKKMGR